MKPLIFFFLLSVNLNFGHTNTIVQKKYGNITIASSTYFRTEEINRHLIIGQYAELLCKQMSYSGEIFIYLLQSPETEFRAWRANSNENPWLDLNINISSPYKDVTSCLNFIENVISNREKLKKNIRNISEWYSAKTSDNVKQIMLNKIMRPDDVIELANPKFFTYYFQDGFYHVLCTDSCETKEIAKLEQILQFSEPKFYILCIFKSPDEILILDANCRYDFEQKKYFVKSIDTNLTMDKTEFKNYNFRPYHILALGKDNIVFESFWSEKVFLYSMSKKIFIQDLDLQIQK